MNKQLRGTLCLLLCSMIWGAAFVAQSVGMDLIGPYAFQAVRCSLAVIGLLPVIAVTDRFKKDGKTFWQRWMDPKLWKAGILCGIPLTLACIFQQIGIVNTDAGKSAFLTAMYIVIVPIIGIFLKKKPSKAVPISVVLAVAGLYFLSCMGVTSISSGDWYLIGCAFMFAVQITFVDLFGLEVDAIRLNTIQSLVCSVIAGIIMLAVEKPAVSTVVQCWLPLCYAGFLSMGAAYTLQIFAQKDLESTAASLLMSLESVFAVLFGCLLLQETMTVWEILGCVLMFIAVILSQLPDSVFKKKQRV